jgi:N-acetylglucosaminyldiphosphoundecaprenol N-acetyl-beta-D-mannosaminyltransferase
MINNNGTYKRADILGFPVNKMTLDDCVNILESFIPARKPRQLVLVNAAKIVKARFDKELRNIIFTADLVGADGLPIVWASKILSDPLPGRVNGTDLMERLVELAARKKYRLYLLGATQEIIEKTAADFQSQYPELILVGCRNGYFKDASEEQLTVQEIADSRADILLVGMGTPMKENFIRRNIENLKVPVIHGVGGSFDIVGGLTKRAPLWMQNSGLEWLYRVYQEPLRMWRRYLVTNTIFIFMILSALIKRVLK